MGKWTLAHMPSQQGKLAVVTGTGGLGYEDALALARSGADVILAGRSAQKGQAAIAQIKAAVPAAKVQFEKLDLASLASIRAFSERLGAQHDRLDLLINNAGVMVPPDRQVTEDGFELQMGTNYLGHFALTGGLMPLLRQSPSARVVSLSSVAARAGQIHFDDLQFQSNYVPMTAYGQSKIACLMFGLELQRRSEAYGWGVTSIAAHPGVSRTDLLHNAPGKTSVQGLARTYLWFLFQPAAQGALPTLYAATAPDARGGAYYGPDGLAETRGYPAEAKIPPQALDNDVARRLWDRSMELTGQAFS
ncbi:oxidoreductase [Devosia chinhatensis]|uniref:Short-chain dehydrogenase n=1 Tax=Devosia chinhatensis TaxID=429727 RepID=A0A0F5FMM1_9HYPH|nr:oxidoreductase [Devosia chinhatensis]KKB10048.1 short-chain dehydrogenase [Devosia chinhatensis]